MRRRDIKAAAKIESVADARELAARRLPKGIFQMFEAGSGSNETASSGWRIASSACTIKRATCTESS